MKYEILKEERVYDGFLKIDKATIRHERFDGKQPAEITRERLERGDSVAIVIYEKDTDYFLFSKQFRYPTVANGTGWLLELIAGVIDEGETPETAARREIAEEIGYSVHQVEFIADFYLSPGGSSERIFLFFAEVNASDKVESGGGIETEDIQLVKIQKSEVMRMMKDNEINDAKTLVGLLGWLRTTGSKPFDAT